MDITVFRATISISVDYLRCYIEEQNKEQDFLAGSSSVNQKQVAGQNRLKALKATHRLRGLDVASFRFAVLARHSCFTDCVMILFFIIDNWWKQGLSLLETLDQMSF